MYMRLVFIPKRLACHVDVSLLDWLKTSVRLFSLQREANSFSIHCVAEIFATMAT